LSSKGDNNVDLMDRPLQNTGINNDDGIRSPNKVSLRKAKEILHESYRRAGQHTRSQSELEYINRLLNQF